MAKKTKKLEHKKLEQNIQNLFKLLGMRIEKTDDGKYFISVPEPKDDMYCHISSYKHYFPDYNKKLFCRVDKLKHFLNLLRTAAFISGVDDHDELYKVKNLYYGCNSLEEMLIKKDLFHRDA